MFTSPHSETRSVSFDLSSVAQNKNFCLWFESRFFFNSLGEMNVFHINSAVEFRAAFRNKIKMRMTHLPLNSSNFAITTRVKQLSHPLWPRRLSRCSIRSQASRWPSVTASKACCRSSVIQLSHSYSDFSKHYMLLHTSTCVAITLRCQTSTELKPRDSCGADAFSPG